MSQDLRSSSATWLDPRAFLYALLRPLVLWATWVIGATLAGYPGAACMTPLAWLLALWAGTLYARRTAGGAFRWPLLAPALVGLTLALGIGALFAYGIHGTMATETRPEEIAKGRTMTLAIVVCGLVVCPALSVATAAAMRRRLARSPQGRPRL